MARQHGIVSDSYDRIVIDSGAVYKDYGLATEELLGATRGGNTFTIETEYRMVEVDGARGPVKGGRRITNVTARIVANFVEIQSETLVDALPGSSAADYPVGSPTHDQITRATALAAADYLTNVAIVGEVAGSTSPIVCGLDNVLADGNIEIAFTDKDESVLAVTFTGHYTAADLDSEPWFIRYPQDVAVTTTTTTAAP